MANYFGDFYGTHYFAKLYYIIPVFLDFGNIPNFEIEFNFNNIENQKIVFDESPKNYIVSIWDINQIQDCKIIVDMDAQNYTVDANNLETIENQKIVY